MFVSGTKERENARYTSAFSSETLEVLSPIGFLPPGRNLTSNPLFDRPSGATLFLHFAALYFHHAHGMGPLSVRSL